MNNTPVFGRAGLGLCVLLALSAFSGCATAPRISLTVPGDQIGSTDVHIGVNTQEIGTTIDPSNVSAASGGGLIFAIIDLSIENSRAKKAEQIIIPVRNALVGFDANGLLSTAVQQELGPISWLKEAKIENGQLAGKDALDNVLKKTLANSVLILETDYYFTPKFEAIVVTTKVSLHARSASLRAKAERRASDEAVLLYYNKLSALSYLPDSPVGLDKSVAANRWAEENGKKAKAALETGLREVAKMIAFDLAQPGTKDHALYASPADTKTNRVVPITANANGGATMINVSGFEVHTDDTRAWVRTPSGELVSVAK